MASGKSIYDIEAQHGRIVRELRTRLILRKIDAETARNRMERADEVRNAYIKRIRKSKQYGNDLEKGFDGYQSRYYNGDPSFYDVVDLEARHRKYSRRTYMGETFPKQRRGQSSAMRQVSVIRTAAGTGG